MGLIRFLAMISGLSKKLIFYWFYKVSRLLENALRKLCIGNAFPMFLELFFGFGRKRGPIPFVLSGFWHRFSVTRKS